MTWSSHTRTVVRECCKGDDQSQWRRENFEPPATPKPLNRSSPKFVKVITSGISTIMQNFFRPDKGFRFRACATSRTIVSAIFWFYPSPTAKTPPRTSTQNTSNDAFYARMCLLGSQSQNLTSTLPFFPKTVILGPDLDGTYKLSAENQL